MPDKMHIDDPKSRWSSRYRGDKPPLHTISAAAQQRIALLPRTMVKAVRIICS
jgi:hypothetical protein